MKRIGNATTIIGLLDRGECAANLDRVLTETTAALHEHTGGRPKAKAKGSVTLKIAIEVESGAAAISYQVDNSVPKPLTGSTVFWVNEDGTLSTEHPKQDDLFAGPRDVTGRQAAE